MKRILMFLFGLILFTQMSAVEISTTQFLRDSLFMEYHSLPHDTLRIKKLQQAARKYIGQSWSIELLDTLVATSKELGYVDGELRALYSYCNYYSYKSDTLNMRLSFERLKEASIKSNIYYYYFRMWSYLLEYKAARGETEVVLLEANQMKQMALQLKHAKGIYYANIAKASAYKAARRYIDLINVYEEILGNNSLLKGEESDIRWYLSRAYLDMNNFEEGIAQMEESVKLLNDSYRLNQVSPNHDKLLEKEVGFCKIYAALHEAEKLLKHLKRAEQYYSLHSHPSLKIGYNLLWATYYQLIQNWNLCFEMFDKTLSYFDGTMPLYEISILKLKAEAMEEAGELKESAESYRSVAKMADSLNRKILQSHEEALQANYIISQAIFEKSKIERGHNRLKILLFALIGMILIAILLRVIYTNKILKATRNETIKLLNIARTVNKDKELFLRNITHQIRTPLNTVVGLSDILSNEERLTDIEKRICVKYIKNDADLLSELISDVLYLSRLESGMMRLNVQEYNVIELCKDALQMFQVKAHSSVSLTLLKAEEKLMISTDSECFINMMVNLLSENIESEAYPTEVLLSVEQEHKLSIVIKTNLLLANQRNDEPFLLDTINSVFIRLLHGEYYVNQIQQRRIVTLMLPLKIE